MATRKAKVTSATGGGPSGFPAPDAITVDELSALLNRDRLARRLSWPAYAQFLKLPQATIYKIYSKVRKRPHQTTIVQILDQIQANPVDQGARTTKAAGVRTRAEKRRQRQGASVPVVPEGREN